MPPILKVHFELSMTGEHEDYRFGMPKIIYDDQGCAVLVEWGRYAGMRDTETDHMTDDGRQAWEIFDRERPEADRAKTGHQHSQTVQQAKRSPQFKGPAWHTHDRLATKVDTLREDADDCLAAMRELLWRDRLKDPAFVQELKITALREEAGKLSYDLAPLAADSPG